MMELMPWRSRQPSALSSLQSEMNRMFEDFFNPTFGFSPQNNRTQAVVPALDVKEDEGNIVVTAELPGIDAKDVDISVQGDMLEIRGQKQEEKKKDEENYHMVERTYGAFCRRVALSPEVDSEKAEASMDNGVLTLRLPKIESKSGKKTISVQASSSHAGKPIGQASEPSGKSPGQAGKSTGQATR